MYILRRLSVFFSSWANIDILHVDSRLLWIETWFIQPLGLVILAAVFPVLQQPGPRWLCRWRADSRPRCGPKRGGAAHSGLHLPPRTHPPFHCSHTRSKSSGLGLDCHLTALSVTHDPPIRCTRSEARTLAPPGSGLRSDLSRLTGGENISLFKTRWCKSDAECSNARTAPDANAQKPGARRCNGLRLASAVLSDKMN